MKALPGSFLLVLAFSALAIGLILYFAFKRFLFIRYKRRGQEALSHGDYLDAITLLSKAEVFWHLNVTYQTTVSYKRDLAALTEILNGLEAASCAAGIELPVHEYLEAVKAVQYEFSQKLVDHRLPRRNNPAAVWTQLENAQHNLREQLRRLKGTNRTSKQL